MQDIITEYNDNFRVRFSTEDFTTDWRLRSQLAALYLSSWFILVMEMLLRYADCYEEKAKVRSPKKASMDDHTDKRCGHNAECFDSAG